jgi:hypothetical protein
VEEGKRGNYKCGRCGEPKKGHVCKNRPKPRNASVQMADSETQAEMDPALVLRTLPGRSKDSYPIRTGLVYIHCMGIHFSC